MEDKTIIIIVAMVLLAALEICAMILGINGVALAAVIGIFGVVVGVPAGVKYQERKA